MAYIRKTKDGWRAEVEKCGVRKTKCFSLLDDANSWAEHTEQRIKMKSERLTLRERLINAETLLGTSIPKRVLQAIGQVPHDLSEVLSAAIPLKNLSGIYFLIKNRDVVYVGQSVNVLHRIGRHKLEERDFDGYAFMECAREDMNRLEALYIDAFIPEMNMAFGVR